MAHFFAFCFTPWHFLGLQWLHRRVGYRNSNKGGVSQALLLFKKIFCLSLYPLSAPFLNPLSSPFPHFPDYHPFLLSDQLSVSQAPLSRGSCALPSVLFLFVCLFLFYTSLKVLVTHPIFHTYILIFPRKCVESHSLNLEMAGYLKQEFI